MLLIGLAIVNAGVLLWFLAPPGPWFGFPRLDLDVYRLGAEVWLAGGDLYGPLPATILGNHLPFTYPPVAAVLFAPLTLMPYVATSFVLTSLSIAALVVVVVVVLRSLGVRPTYVIVGAVLPVAMLLEPVRDTLYFGQINVLLMVLVVLDCLVTRPRWPRGVLVGLAAAVKLTPAAFVLFFLVRGDRRAAMTAVASFLCGSAAGFVLNPAGSVRYWTSILFDPDRIGAAAYESNQSINGLLARLGIERCPLWLVAVAVVAGIGALAVRRAAHPADALGLNAFTVLLVSPVSWSHHWVWVVPVLLAAWRARPALAAAALVPFLLSPHFWWNAGEGWPPLTLIIGNAYVWCAVLVLAWRSTRPTRASSTTAELGRPRGTALVGGGRHTARRGDRGGVAAAGRCDRPGPGLGRGDEPGDDQPAAGE